jgi:tol-pal system protein YbgF
MVDTCRQPDIAAMTSLMSRGLTAAALAASLCIATAASAQDDGSPLSVLDRMFGQKSSSDEPRTSGQGVAQAPATDLVLRIDRLEAQIRQLTGTIEQLQYRNRQLEAQIRGMGGTPGVQPQGPLPRPAQPMAPPGPAASALPPPGATPAPGRRSDVFDPALHPNAPGAPHALGSMPTEPPPVVTAEPPVGVPGGRGAGAPLDLSTLATGINAPPAVAPSGPVPPAAVPSSAAPGSAPLPASQSAAIGSSPSGPLPPPPASNPSATGVVASVAPPSNSPKDYYDLAYGYVLRKDYALAEQAFQNFLKKFPNDRRAPDAEFWLGESLFQRQNYDAAASAFLDLSTKHGSHGKAPDALLRLAQSLAAMKQKEMACATLAEVGRKYPRASHSVKQGVEREQKRVHC